MKKRYLTGIFTLSLFLYLIFFPADALEAVREGLSLWYRSVLPVMLPFLILSGITTRFGLTRLVPELLLRPVRHLFRCSHQGSFAIVSGFLCGFPMGAKVTRDLQENHLITDEEANFLYGFTNNVSPAFLLSFLAQEQLKHPEYKCFFLFCVMGAAILFGLMTRPEKKRVEHLNHRRLPESSGRTDESDFFRTMDDCIRNGITAVISLGAYITVFSLLSAAAVSLLPPDRYLRAAVMGILEITGGCASVTDLELPPDLKVIWLCAICSFGGLSVFAQTVSITSMNRSAACRYLKSRVIITLLASWLAMGILFFRSILVFG